MITSQTSNLLLCIAVCGTICCTFCKVILKGAIVHAVTPHSFQLQLWTCNFVSLSHVF